MDLEKCGKSKHKYVRQKDILDGMPVHLRALGIHTFARSCTPGDELTK